MDGGGKEGTGEGATKEEKKDEGIDDPTRLPRGVNLAVGGNEQQVLFDFVGLGTFELQVL